MLVKLAGMDDWEPLRLWSADITLPLKCKPALQQCLPVCAICPCLNTTSGWSGNSLLGEQQGERSWGERREGGKGASKKVVI